MIEPHPTQPVLEDLLARLQLTVAPPDKAYGEVEGNPVTMTVLGMEPLALLLGFKIQSPHPSQIEVPDDIAALVSQKKAEVSLERGLAWFSLDDLTGEKSESIEASITSFANALSRANVRLPDGCVQCRSEDDVTVVYSDGRCTRLCANCRDRVVDEHVQQEAKLNHPSIWFALSLPLMFLYVSCAWMLLWWLVDMGFIWTRTDTIKLGRYEMMLIFVVLAAIAGAIGYPIGVFLRRSGIPGRTHWLARSAVVLVACAVGEWLYVATVLYRLFGLIDLVVAARMSVPYFTGYHPSWMASKLIVAGAVGIGCHCGATWRTAAVKL
jgi:hypothetical protein